MRIGVDLDNTLVCYDQLFWKLAAEREWITRDIAPSKERVRDELRRLGRESDWTLLQGEVYGSQMNEAMPFPGALNCLKIFCQRGWSVNIVSHRTKTPYVGPMFDLHAAARSWLQHHDFLDVVSTGLHTEGVYLETTKQEKLKRIGSLELDWFIDDLPELLQEPTFPADVRKLLFDPHGRDAQQIESILIASHWREIPDLIANVGCQ